MMTKQKKHTLFIKDLLLDVNKSLLKVILEEKFEPDQLDYGTELTLPLQIIKKFKII